VSFEKTLGVIARAFESNDFKWALIGGLAVGIHGMPRTTIDVDVLVDKKALPVLDAALLGAGYALEYRWDESSHFTQPPGLGLAPVDVLHAHRLHSLNMLARALPRAFGSTENEYPVVQAEDLVGLKVQALSNDRLREVHEIADLRSIFETAAETHSPLNLEQITEYFELFGRVDLLNRLLEGLDNAVR
jgi:hypothetical protein